MLAASEVLVHCEHTQLGLHNQTVVLGEGGLLLPTPLPLREGSTVRIQVSGDGQWVHAEATIAHTLLGWGTVFRFSSLEGWGWGWAWAHQRLVTWLSKDEKS